MPSRLTPPPLSKCLSAPPPGYVKGRDLLAQFGWSPQAWGQVEELRQILDPEVVWVRVKTNAVRFVPKGLKIPLAPRLERKKADPAPARETEALSVGDGSLKERRTFAYTEVKNPHGSYLVTTLPASVLVSQYTIRRFKADKEGGVNRVLDHHRAVEMAVAMQEGGAIMSDNFVIAIDGEFSARGGNLTIGPGTQLEIIDGQHRTYALQALTGEELKRWSFTCHIFRNLSIEDKRRLFYEQTERRPIHKAQALALRAELGMWKTGKEKLAYEVCEHINQDATSPLQGMVDTDEPEFGVAGDSPTGSAKTRVQTEPGRVTITSLMGAVSRIYNKNSPLYRMTSKEIGRIFVTTLAAAKRTWPTTWNDRTSEIRRIAGIEALLELHNQSLFTAVVGGKYTNNNIMAAIQRGARFRWNSDRVRQALAIGRAGLVGSKESVSAMLARVIHSKVMSRDEELVVA
jgi:hypothetical protein